MPCQQNLEWSAALNLGWSAVPLHALHCGKLCEPTWLTALVAKQETLQAHSLGLDNWSMVVPIMYYDSNLVVNEGSPDQTGWL